MRIGLVAALVRAAEHSVEELPTLRLPYLALHGGSDPICLPAAAEIIRQRSGSPDTTVKVYQGLYHEVHNEPEQEQVLRDIGDWLDAHVP
jgi:alpha-beta hydrolase superfamily lysophospholipase